MRAGHLVQRQLYLVDYTLGALRRRLGRNLMLLAVCLLLVFLLASVMLFVEAVRREAADILQDAPQLTVQKLRMGRHEMISGDSLAPLAAIRGVQRAEGRLWGYFYDPANGANYTLMAPAAGYPAVAPGETVVGEGVARAKSIAKGGYLFLLPGSGKLLKMKVADVLTSGSALVGADLVLMSEADLRRFFELPAGVYTDLALSIRNEREIDTIAAKAAALLPDGRFITRRDILRTYDSIFSWREGMVLLALAGSLVAFMILAFDKASGLSAEERREIGILKAIGWETSDIIAMKFWEGALVSLAAFLVGVVLAYLHVFWFSAGLLEPILEGWAVLYPRFTLTPAVDLLQIASLAFFTIVPFTAATLVPIWRAAITDPDEVMR